MSFSRRFQTTLLLCLLPLACVNAEPSHSPEAQTQIDGNSILGRWRGKVTGDPHRSSFGIAFESDRAFSCFSTTVVELHMVDRTTGEGMPVPRTIHSELRGEFRIEGSELLLDFGEERLTSWGSCGLWLGREGPSTIRLKVGTVGSELVLRALDESFELHYERELE